MESKNQTTEDVMDADEVIDYDYVLTNELGQFGKYQAINMLLLMTSIMTHALISEYVFSAARLPHRSVSSLYRYYHEPLLHT